MFFDGADLSAFRWLDTSVVDLTEWVRFQLADHEIAGVFLWVSSERCRAGLGPRINRHISHGTRTPDCFLVGAKRRRAAKRPSLPRP